jgi:hypothetical protein
MKFICLLASLCFYVQFWAQPTQTVRGVIRENETEYEIPGATVKIIVGEKVFGAVTDINGEYRIDNVPVGKHDMQITYSGFEPQTISVTVNSGNQAIYDVKLAEKVREIGEVEIVGVKEGEVKNEMATVSAQQFSVAETERFAGSRGDPARMASNFAGVQGADDSRNDIVVRGNSPLGIVYKVEGVDIPNPSHFSISGSSGGPVSIINNKSLANSDFFMSAFPAEYGNSLSGIFDLKLRNGNNERHEFTGQFGFLGTEFLTEGPLNRKTGSSYLVMGRYSTLSLFQFMGIKIGTDAVPAYGDGAFKFNFPLKNKGYLSFWGLGGKSNIAIKISDQTEFSTEFYGEGDRDQYFGTAMATTGLTYKKSLSEKTLFTATLAGSFENQHSKHDYLIRSLDTTNVNGEQQVRIRVDSIYQLMGYAFNTSKGSLSMTFNHKISKQHILRFGLNSDLLFFNMQDSVLDVSHTYFINRWNYKGNAALFQPFVQWKYKVNDQFQVTAGLHSQYFTLSNSLSAVEPRIGFKYNSTKEWSFFGGAGLHSQVQPYYTYSYHLENTQNLHNKNMGFSKAAHSALGVEKNFKKGFVVRSEVYYQYLYQIPVTVQPSSFSMINQGSGFARFFPDTLKNDGTGVNYGIELTIQKFFDKSFYMLFTTSIYDSKYKGSDGIERNTSYNGMYTSNFLFGKEIKLNDKQTIGIGGKITVAGGKRYGYVDLAATNQQNEIIYKDSLFNERQFRDYFRADLKLSWKLNADKVTHEIGLDLVNLLNTRNILSLAYAPNLADPSAEPIAEKTQLGFLPLFYYRIGFKLAAGKK